MVGTTVDPSSGGNINTNCFGPIFWSTMHLTSFGYSTNPTEMDKRHYYTFYENIGNVLPCNKCKEHYRKNFNPSRLMASLQSRSTLTRYVYDLHNIVNDLLGVKLSDRPTFEEVYRKYEAFRTDCHDVCGGPDSEIACSINFSSNEIVDRLKDLDKLSITDQKKMMSNMVEHFHDSDNTSIIIGSVIGALVLLFAMVYYFMPRKIGKKR